MSNDVILENDHWRVRLDPASGGTVVSGQVRVGDAWVHVLRPTPDSDRRQPMNSASYPLVPWSNRIRDGLLTWRGKNYQLRINFADGTAIHGAAWEFPWGIRDQSATHVVLEFDSSDFVGVNYPWAFRTTFTYTLDDAGLTVRMELTNSDGETFPAGFGHHPFFMRTLASDDGTTVGESAHLQVNCDKGYDLEACMPTGPAGDVPAHADYRELRPVGDTFVDDCFTDRTSDTLAIIEYPQALRLTMEADRVLSHSVVYVPPGESIFAVEPVSNANEGFNLHGKGVTGLGVVELEPGQTLSAEFTLTAQDLTA